MDLSTINQTSIKVLYSILSLLSFLYIIFHKRKESKLSTKEILNYNICVCYILICIFFHIPEDFLMLSINDSDNIREVYTISIIYNSFQIIIYCFYMFLFYIVLHSNVHLLNHLILYWLSGFSSLLLFLGVLLQNFSFFLSMNSAITIIPLIVCIREIVDLIGICKEYNKKDIEEQGKSKNYKKLFIFGFCQILILIVNISVFGFDCFFFIMYLKKNDDAIQYVIQIYNYDYEIKDSLNCLLHFCFFLFFILDENVIERLKMIFTCNKKEIDEREIAASMRLFENESEDENTVN